MINKSKFKSDMSKSKLLPKGSRHRFAMSLFEHAQKLRNKPSNLVDDKHKVFDRIEINVVFASLLSFVKCKIPRKQLEVLRIIDSVEEESNATRLITLISGSLECSTSTSWNMLRALNKSGLIECGTKENKGKLVTLTKLGKIVIGEKQPIIRVIRE